MRQYSFKSISENPTHHEYRIPKLGQKNTQLKHIERIGNHCTESLYGITVRASCLCVLKIPWKQENVTTATTNNNNNNKNLHLRRVARICRSKLSQRKELQVSHFAQAATVTYTKYKTSETGNS